MKKLYVFIVISVMALVVGTNASATIIDPAQVAYTTNVEPFWFTPDNNHNLSNGIVPLADLYDPDWCGYGSSELLEVNFNLNGTYTLTAVDVSYAVVAAWSQNAPSSIDLTFSTDGVNFNNLVTWTSFISDDGGWTASVTVPNITCQYVKAALTASIGNDGYYWHRLCEFTFNQVPEPMTMSLLGIGSLALIRRKK